MTAINALTDWLLAASATGVGNGRNWVENGN